MYGAWGNEMALVINWCFDGRVVCAGEWIKA